MEDLMKDKALLVVMAVGIFASGYYFHEYNAFGPQTGPVQSAYSDDSASALDQAMSASAANSIDTISLSDDAFTSIEDISAATSTDDDSEDASTAQ
jgi:hypothetical protein